MKAFTVNANKFLRKTLWKLIEMEMILLTDSIGIYFYSALLLNICLHGDNDTRSVSEYFFEKIPANDWVV